MIENFIAGERRRSSERGIMDQNGISEDTKGRIAVLGFYFFCTWLYCLRVLRSGTAQTCHLDGNAVRNYREQPER